MVSHRDDDDDEEEDDDDSPRSTDSESGADLTPATSSLLSFDFSSGFSSVVRSK